MTGKPSITLGQILTLKDGQDWEVVYLQASGRVKVRLVSSTLNRWRWITQQQALAIVANIPPMTDR
jgi:hypothetical protein